MHFGWFFYVIPMERPLGGHCRWAPGGAGWVVAGRDSPACAWAWEGRCAGQGPVALFYVQGSVMPDAGWRERPGLTSSRFLLCGQKGQHVHNLFPYLPAKGVALHPGSGATHCMSPTCFPEEGGHTRSVPFWEKPSAVRLCVLHLCGNERVPDFQVDTSPPGERLCLQGTFV